MLAGNDLATTENVLETVRAMLAVRNEVKKALKQIGVAPIVPDDVEEEQEDPNYSEPVTKTTSAEIDTLLKKKKNMSTDELENYWEDAASKQASVPTNPDVITFDQARQLGLAPKEE